jgi:myo-inositol-1(or 4)-monophosphatase
LPAPDLDLLARAATEAGALAASFWRNGVRTWKKPDDTPVTEADLAVNDLLADRLQSARPDYGWLSEETADTADRLDRMRVFIVDPIDGTRAFARGQRDWAVALAVVDRGIPSAAAVFLPVRDKLYLAAQGAGATLNGEPISASRCRGIDGARLLSNASALAPDRWLGPVPCFHRENRASLAYRMAMVAEGRFDATLSFRDTWEWDLAPGALIATEAGARVCDARGAPFRFNARPPVLPGVLVAAPGLYGDIRTRMAVAAA